jgi:hypothetical protein
MQFKHYCNQVPTPTPGWQGTCLPELKLVSVLRPSRFGLSVRTNTPTLVRTKLCRHTNFVDHCILQPSRDIWKIPTRAAPTPSGPQAKFIGGGKAMVPAPLASHAALGGARVGASVQMSRLPVYPVGNVSQWFSDSLTGSGSLVNWTGAKVSSRAVRTEHDRPHDLGGS